MATFRLEPVSQQINSPHWESSIIGPITCWVNGSDAEQARWAVTFATITARWNASGHQSPIMPYMHEHMARCVVDNERQVPAGTVVTEEGELLLISEA